MKEDQELILEIIKLRWKLDAYRQTTVLPSPPHDHKELIASIRDLEQSVNTLRYQTGWRN